MATLIDSSVLVAAERGDLALDVFTGKSAYATALPFA
jgi:hypothetical protein